MSVGFRRGRPERPFRRAGGGAPIINILPSLPTLPQQGTGTLAGVTCTRAGIRSCLKSDGSLVKLTTNQLAVEANGILIERGVTNLITSSEASNTNWSSGNSTVTPNQAAAPDATLTADLLGLQAVPASVPTSELYLTAGVTGTAAPYLFSLWAKRTGGTSTFWTHLAMAGGAGRVSAQCDATAAWQRFQLPATLTAATWFPSIGVYTGAGQTAPAQDVLVWGAQLELNYPHAYVPTTGTSAASADDVVTIANPLSGQAVGFTFGLSATPTYGRTWESRTGTVALWQLGTAGANDSIAVSRDASNKVVVVLQDAAGGTKTYTSAGTLTGATAKRIVFTYVRGTGGTVTIDGAADAGSWSGAGSGNVTLGATFTLGRHGAAAGTMLDGHIYNITMTA